MQFSMESAVLAAYLKSMIRIVPDNSSLLELNGFLVECDTDDGLVRITATNYETSIQRISKAEVQSSGGFVIPARVFLGISEHLSGGETVTFSDKKKGRVTITCGTTIYVIPVLEACNYPKPEMPFPEDTLKVTGICDLYGRTCGSVGEDKSKIALTGVHLDIYSDTIKATGCDGCRIATTKMASDCGGQLSVTIPKRSLYYLANAVNNEDVLDVGIVNKDIVFTKPGLIFKAKMIDAEYINIDMLLNSNDKLYSANVDVNEFYKAVNGIYAAAQTAEGGAAVNMSFLENEINFNLASETSGADITIPAVISKPMPAPGFYYSAKKLHDCFKTIKGSVKLHVSSQGILLASDNDSLYMLLNVRPVSVGKKKTKAA